MHFYQVLDYELFNIYHEGIWSGSRRTERQCEVFMADREEETTQLPLLDTHIRMRRTFITFGAGWWYQVWKEIERRERREAINT
jgi:hypothetical protein